ncbi:hypothetical protein LY78DRAFT_38527 [Colletotrichum sublineola]|nr:hypothetical protein LY78DRAFT_38527 [Colletotrichum sublineola]
MCMFPPFLSFLQVPKRAEASHQGPKTAQMTFPHHSIRQLEARPRAKKQPARSASISDSHLVFFSQRNVGLGKWGEGGRDSSGFLSVACLLSLELTTPDTRRTVLSRVVQNLANSV